MRPVSLWLTALVLALSSSPAFAQAYEPLAEIGGPVPATDLSFAEFEPPVIGLDRDIAFRATLEGSGVTRDNDRGLFLYRSGDIATMIVRLGETLPGAEGPTEGVADARVIADSRVVFGAAYFSDIEGGTNGIWRFTPGEASPEPIAVHHNQVPESEIEWRFPSNLRATASGAGIYWGSGLRVPPGGLRETAFSGTATGAPNDARLLVYPSFDANDNETSAVSQQYMASGAGSWAVSANYREDPDPRERALFVNGDIVLREHSGGYPVMEVIGINDAGRVLFNCGPSGNVQRPVCVYDDAGARELIAPGAEIPDAGGATIRNGLTQHRTVLGGGGHVASVVGIDTSGDSAIIVFAPDLAAPRLVVRRGDDAPGLTGVTFGTLNRADSGISGGTIATNATGNVLFRADLEGDGITLSNKDSLWVYDRAADEIRLVVRQDQAIEVDGDPWTVTDFDIWLGSGAQDGQRTGYADNGEIGLYLAITPGEPPGDLGGMGRTFVGVTDDGETVRRIGRAPIGAGGGGADMGMDADADADSSGDGSGNGGGSSNDGGGCSVASGPSSIPPALLALLFVATRRRDASRRDAQERLA